MLKDASLSSEQLHVIKDKGTEYPHTGAYTELDVPGSYLCRRCGLALFRADSKFSSSCGWPSFDAEIENNIAKQPDADGKREEVICKRCRAHLGHVFYGEQLTSKNKRYCINSLSLDFVTDEKVNDSEEAIIAAGCFWGVEYYFKKMPGVLKTEVGYTGGSKENPSYHDICAKNTGHYEAVRVLYNPAILTYEDVIKFFFEIHNFEQRDGQGPDIGQQYHSAVFCYDAEQNKILKKIIQHLNEKGYQVATNILRVSTFWPAEEYHQDYYQKQSKEPYCHRYNKIF